MDTLLEQCPGISIGVECPGWPSMPWAPLQVSMVQSAARRERMGKPDLVVIDEAHHARAKTWETVLSRWPNAKRIGLTATPERLDGKGLGNHFSEMVIGPTIPWLVADGSLAPSRTLRIPGNLRLEGLRTGRNGDYRADDVGQAVTGAVIADAVNAYMRYADRSKTRHILWRTPRPFHVRCARGCGPTVSGRNTWTGMTRQRAATA